MIFRTCESNAGVKRIFISGIALVAFLFSMSWAAFAQEEGYVPLSDEFTDKQFVGKKITMDLQDAEIKTVLRMISEVSGYNIVTGDDVYGKITIKLDNVPWDQALEIILRTKKLGMQKQGNIIRIAPQATLTAESQAKLAERQALLQLEDLVLELIPVSYADATELLPQVRTVASSRGMVQVDERTNVIVIKDIKKNLDEARKLIKSLDSQTPQVLIEARIVEATTDFTRQIGVKWGGRYVADAAHGNATGLSFPNSIGVTGAEAGGQQYVAEGQTQQGGQVGTSQTGSQITGMPDSNYMVNLPAAIGEGSGGGLGITMGSINDTLSLDLQLSAMESHGEGRIISQPKVTTLDNKEASITAGVSIPFQIRQQGETSLSFIEANLNLTVEPHVTADESIIMKIEIAKNAPNTSIPTSTGDPAIDKKEAKTEALVRNGETTVIAGLFQIEKSKTERSVPWLSKIPVLGIFFKATERIDDRMELLIFITPRIIRDKPAI